MVCLERFLSHQLLSVFFRFDLDPIKPYVLKITPEFLIHWYVVCIQICFIRATVNIRIFANLCDSLMPFEVPGNLYIIHSFLLHHPLILTSSSLSSPSSIVLTIFTTLTMSSTINSAWGHFFVSLFTFIFTSPLLCLRTFLWSLCRRKTLHATHSVWAESFRNGDRPLCSFSVWPSHFIYHLRIFILWLGERIVRFCFIISAVHVLCNVICCLFRVTELFVTLFTSCWLVLGMWSCIWDYVDVISTVVRRRSPKKTSVWYITSSYLWSELHFSANILNTLTSESSQSSSMKFYTVIFLKVVCARAFLSSSFYQILSWSIVYI